MRRLHRTYECVRQHALHLPRLTPPKPQTPNPRASNIKSKHRGSVETGEFWDGLLGTWEAMTTGHFLDFVDDHDVGK